MSTLRTSMALCFMYDNNGALLQKSHAMLLRLQISARVHSSGNGRRHVSLPRPDLGRKPTAFLRHELRRVWRFSSAGDVGVPQKTGFHVHCLGNRGKRCEPSGKKILVGTQSGILCLERRGFVENDRVFQATRQQSLNYGCIVENKSTHEVTHYVEKPETFVSTSINCGIYLFAPEIFQHIGVAFQKNQEEIRWTDFSKLQMKQVRFVSVKAERPLSSRDCHVIT